MTIEHNDAGLRGIYKIEDVHFFDGFKYYSNRYSQNIEQCANEAEEIIESLKRAVPKKKQDKEFLKQSKIVK